MFGYLLQVQGAFIQGLGFYLSEEYRYNAESGKVCHLLSVKLLSYSIELVSTLKALEIILCVHTIYQPTVFII